MSSLMITSNLHRNLKYTYCFLAAYIGVFFNPLESFGQNKKIDSLNIELNKHQQTDDIRARTLFELAAQKLQYDAVSALKSIDEIISLKEKIVNENIVSAAYRVKGIIFYHTSRYNEALVLLDKALIIDRKLKSYDGIGGDLGTIGLIHMTQSKFPEALKYYLESLSNFEKTKKNQVDIALTLVNIGTVYSEMGASNQAMNNYQKSYQLFKKINHYSGQSNTLANIGIIHFKNKDINEAIRYSKLSLKIVDSLGDLRGVARENGNLSAYYGELGMHDLALIYGLKAIEINKKISGKKSLGFNYQNVSSAYLKKGNYQLAKSYGLEAQKIGKELNVTEIKRETSLGLSEVYEALKMPDSALFYHKEFYKFADTISNDKKKNEIMKMGMQFDFDKKELSYQQKQVLADEQLKQQSLQLALNNAELQKGIQLRDLQKISLENQKLLNQEKEKQLIILKANEKLQINKVHALSQEQKLNKLELKQLWLYGLLAILVLASFIIYLINLYRIRQLRFKNVLQNQEALQNEILLKHQFQLTESELKAIRSQMNPHFIFNVLNSIEAYIMENDKKTASRLIQKFASLSRLILENSTKSLVSADKEWKALMLYTELEAMRYNNSFTFSFIVDEEIKLKTLFLPPMLVQPLIENAILHGLIVDQNPDAHLEVRLKKHNEGICITVEDNGIGIENKPKDNIKIGIKEKSIGLSSIKERIDIINSQINNCLASFSISASPSGNGTFATILLPHFENAQT
ncbi:MAG: tetratricopeptide repeat protein [Pedobacter sp.]|nr:MAG: tetratricopeptide repeat protein [Pedobacter sp.]